MLRRIAGIVLAVALVAAPAQAGVTVKNTGVGPPQWYFAFHPDDAITMSPGFVIGITAPGLAGTGLNMHMPPGSPPQAESGFFVAGRPGPNTITWHWDGSSAFAWSASASISNFIQSAPGGVSAPLGGAFYEYPGGAEHWMTIAPDTMVGIIPEPATLSLMGAALLAALLVRPGRKR